MMKTHSDDVLQLMICLLVVMLEEDSAGLTGSINSIQASTGKDHPQQLPQLDFLNSAFAPHRARLVRGRRRQMTFDYLDTDSEDQLTFMQLIWTSALDFCFGSIVEAKGTEKR